MTTAQQPFDDQMTSTAVTKRERTNLTFNNEEEQPNTRLLNGNRMRRAQGSEPAPMACVNSVAKSWAQGITALKGRKQIALANFLRRIVPTARQKFRLVSTLSFNPCHFADVPVCKHRSNPNRGWRQCPAR
jgi:hypothetical protein